MAEVIGAREAADVERFLDASDRASERLTQPRYDEQSYHEQMRAMFDQPTHILHMAGRSYRYRNCARCHNVRWREVPSATSKRPEWLICTDCGGGEAPECEVFGLSADHRDGRCFSCSGVAEPQRLEAMPAVTRNPFARPR